MNGASPDDPYLTQYWENRKNLGVNSTLTSAGDLRIAKKQYHICPICFDSLYNEETIEKHHILPKYKGGLDTYDNLVWLHQTCHQQIKGKEIENIEVIRTQLSIIKDKSKSINKLTG
jgi:RNA-directed DNA polymerase